MADIDADKVQSLIQSALSSAAQASQHAEKALAEGESLVRMGNESPLLMDNEAMTGVSKDLLDARLEAVEARMDARMARIEGLVSSISQSQAEMRKEVELMRQESKADNKSTRTTMIVTGISSVLAIVLGVGAFNATVLSNMVASFESGKSTATMQAASEKAIIEATKALEAATEKTKQSPARP